MIRGNASSGSMGDVHQEASIIAGNTQALSHQDNLLLNIGMAITNRSIES